MATSDDSREVFQRRVQARIAGQFLKQIDPDALEDPDRYSGTNAGKLTSQIDPETQKKFEAKFGKYRRKESVFSIVNVLWLVAGVAVFYFSDVVMVIRYDPRVDRLWFNIGSVLMGINISIAMFLVVYLSQIKKISSDDWERHYPALIPIATAAFIFGGISLTVGLWPVWGLLTVPILFTMFMSFVVFVAMFG
ncbi:transmembrane protein 128-like [Haliotis rubra]|uniref:transmembrane protein 128-like n=1 Tax=Haliotis rubra TaxID=36100 RepID=UPI001EE633C1|nr:transmembrane protein 128-like [Haliotis rubra]